MIQATLIFILGFLAAAFLMVLVAPAIWRRAVVLTRRRIEAALPLSMAEIRADKDALRARYAVRTRQLEMKAAALNEKLVKKSLEIESLRSEMRKLVHSLEEKDAAHQQILIDREQELKRLGEMYDETSFMASNRQIELVAQETNIERMREEISALERALDTEKSRDCGKEVAGADLLRERISDLAAQMVSLTARIEGEGSQIHALLGADSKAGLKDRPQDRSLAARIRALQK